MPGPITNPKQKVAVAIAEKSKNKGFSAGKSLGKAGASDLFKVQSPKSPSVK